jgi:transposase
MTRMHAPNASRRREGVHRYSGKHPSIIDASTGETIDVELFVMVLGASNYRFAEVTRTQEILDFIGPASLPPRH